MIFAMVALFGVLGMITLFANMSAPVDEKLEGIGLAIYSVTMILGFLASIWAFQISFTVTKAGAVIAWGPFGFPRRTIAWDKVVKVESINVRPTEWGGWGYRINFGNKSSAAVLRKGPGLKFTFSNGRVFVITIDKPDKALAAIEKAMPHNHATCGHNHDDWTTYVKPD